MGFISWLKSKNHKGAPKLDRQAIILLFLKVIE
jgi:hypothetical protein